jgi:hypothetical protein
MPSEPSTPLSLSIAGISLTLDFTGCGQAIRERVTQRYINFIIAPQTTTLVIHCQEEQGPLFIPFAEDRIMRITAVMSAQRLDFCSHFESGWWDRKTGDGWLTLRPQGDPENFLRVLYAWLCLERGWLMVHACGIVHKGKGYVFFGESGAGKTTVASLSSGDTVLSDDMVIIEHGEGCYRVHGVPFRGLLPYAPRSNFSANLYGLFTLEKTHEHYLTQLEKGKAVAKLAANVPFVMADITSVRRVLALCRDLVEVIPVKTLHFRRDSGFWRIIDEAI